MKAVAEKLLGHLEADVVTCQKRPRGGRGNERDQTAALTNFLDNLPLHRVVDELLLLRKGKWVVELCSCLLCLVLGIAFLGVGPKKASKKDAKIKTRMPL